MPFTKLRLPWELVIKAKDPAGLVIDINTKRLKIRSIEMSDLKNCVRLYADKNVMEKFAEGPVIDSKLIESYVNEWVRRFENSDPFSAYVVIEKVTGKFVGLCIIGHSNEICIIF